MKIEGFHEHTGQWVTLYEADEMTYGEGLFVKDFAEGGHSHASIGSASVNRKHFSAFRLVGGKPDDDLPVCTCLNPDERKACETICSEVPF